MATYKNVVILSLLVLIPRLVNAQNVSTEPEHDPSTLSASRPLPNAPEPKITNEADPQPDRYSPWKDDRHDPLNDTDKSWLKAESHPYMVGASAVLATLTAIELRKTDRCITEDKPACNLLTRKNRTANYALNIPLTAGVIWLGGKLKKEGHGNAAVGVLFGSFIYESTIAYTANPHVLVCQSGRVPQCQ